jgi:hypothetical protein
LATIGTLIVIAIIICIIIAILRRKSKSNDNPQPKIATSPNYVSAPNNLQYNIQPTAASLAPEMYQQMEDWSNAFNDDFDQPQVNNAASYDLYSKVNPHRAKFQNQYS